MNHKKAGILKLNPVIIFTALFVIFILIAYFPLLIKGKSVVWNTDSLGQYYPAFLYIGQYIRSFLSGLIHGKIILPTYDLSIGMGEDVVGTLNYYGFGDPINLLAVLATKSNGAVIFTLAYFLRLYLGAISFIMYCRKVKISDFAAMLGAILWISTGFVLDGGLRYIEWLSVLIFFPLMLYGVEDIITDKRHRMFVLAVVYASLCGFYYLFMSTLALAIYCIARTVAKNGSRNVALWLTECIKMVPYYILSLMLSAPILLPSIKAFLLSERNDSERAYAYITNYIPHPQLLLRFLKNSLVPSYYINYGMGIVVVEWVLVIILVFKARTTRTKQLIAGVIIALAAVSLPITGSLFNGFGENNDRWMFLVHFVFIVAFADAIDSYKTETIKLALICFAVAINILFNHYYVLSPLGDNWRDEFITYADAPEYTASLTNLSDVITGDNDFYRISCDMMTEVNGRPENVAMINNYYGLTYWFSIVNGYTQKYVDKICNEKMIWRSYGFDNNGDAEQLSGCKYYLSRRGYDGIEGHKKTINPDYKLVETIEFNGYVWDVYENPNFCGMVYTNGLRPIPAAEYEKTRGLINCEGDFDGSELLCMAIPYSKDWKMYVDGEAAEIMPYEMFLSAKVPEGHHKITIKYRNSAYAAGVVLMIVAGMICLLVGVRIPRVNNFNII